MDQEFYGIILRSLYTLLYIEIKNIGLQLHSFSYCYPLLVTNTFSGITNRGPTEETEYSKCCVSSTSYMFYVVCSIIDNIE